MALSLVRRVALLVLAPLLATSVLTAGVVRPAQAEPPTVHDDVTRLSMPTFVDVATDPSRGRAFVSGGGGVDAIVIVDEDAEPIGTLEVPHAGEMLMAPDGQTLYVAQPRERAVVAVDLDTFAQTRFDLGEDFGHEITRLPLTWAAGLLWFVGQPHANARLGTLDPLTGEISSVTLTYGISELTSSPARPDLLVAGDGSYVDVYQVSGGATPGAELVRRREMNQTVRALAMSPDGREVVVGGDVYQYPVLRVRDLALVDSYPTERSTRAIAIRSDGQVALDATFPGDSTGDPFANFVNIYASGHTSAPAQHYLPRDESRPDGRTGVPANGLAWSGDRLYVVTQDERDGNPIIGVVDGDAPTEPLTGVARIEGPYFGDIAVDPRSGRVFVTQGDRGNGLYVADKRGRVVEVIEHLPGAAGMTFDRAGTTLYVALGLGDAIAAVDVATLKVTKIPVGAQSCPRFVAFTGGRLWFSGGCLHSRGALMTLDVGTGRVRRAAGDGYGDDLVTSPLAPRSLWATHRDFVSGSLVRFQVTDRGRPAAEQKQTVGVGPSHQEKQVTPDGLHLVAALPVLPHHLVLSARGLVPVGQTSSQLHPNAVAVRSDGLVAAGVDDEVPGSYGGSGPYEWTVRVSASALGKPVRDVRLPLADKIERGGVAFGRRDLYTVSQERGDLVVGVHRMPALRPITLTADKSAYERGDKAKLVAHLVGRSPRGTSVVFYRVGKKGRSLVARTRADAFGNARTTVRARPGQRYVVVTGPRGQREVSRLRLDVARG